jgi:hypothetical protein
MELTQKNVGIILFFIFLTIIIVMIDKEYIILSVLIIMTYFLGRGLMGSGKEKMDDNQIVYNDGGISAGSDAVIDNAADNPANNSRSGQPQPNGLSNNTASDEQNRWNLDGETYGAGYLDNKFYNNPYTRVVNDGGIISNGLIIPTSKVIKSGYPNNYVYDLNDANFYAQMDGDEKIMMTNQLKTRDKECIDGYVSRNSDYYKKNFGDELDEFEKKRWWGNAEY